MKQRHHAIRTQGINRILENQRLCPGQQVEPPRPMVAQYQALPYTEQAEQSFGIIKQEEPYFYVLAESDR